MFRTREGLGRCSMSKILVVVVVVLVCTSVSLAVWDYEITTSGYHSVDILTSNERLLMTKGWVSQIYMKDVSYVEIQGTDSRQGLIGGVENVILNGNSSLEFQGGEMITLDMRYEAHALLRGGQIDFINSYQRPRNPIDPPGTAWDKHIEMIVKEYEHSRSTNMLTGLWEDDTVFSIQLVDQDGFHPAISNIEFTIVPEPATLFMLGLGGVFLRKRWAFVKA